VTRRRICVGCRSLLGDDENCARGGGHDVVSLDFAEGRARLDDEVWGPDSRARKLRQAARAGAGGGTFGGLLDGCGGLDGCDVGGDIGSVIAGIVVIIAFAIVAVVLYWLIKMIIRLVRELLDRPVPHGALLPAPGRRNKKRISGVVRAGTRVPSPWGASAPLGYALALFAKRVVGGGAVLRDAMVGELEVALDDGRVMRVPAGRAWIHGSLRPVDGASEAVASLVGDVDSVAGRKLLPVKEARALTIEPGDRVDVLCDVETRADAAQGGAYRQSAGVVVPRGVPVLRVRKAKVDVRTRVAVDGDGEAPESLAATQLGDEVDEVEEQRRAR
jgi:hypothetical protein